WDPVVGSHLAGMGVLGLLAPESAGGLGVDEIDLVLILEECGRAALAGPLVEHAAVAVPALTGAADGSPAVGTAAAAWLRAAASGDIVVSAGPAGAEPVPYGAEAGLLLVERDGLVHAVPRSDVTGALPRTSVDRSRRFADVTWSGTTPLPG